MLLKIRRKTSLFFIFLFFFQLGGYYFPKESSLAAIRHFYLQSYIFFRGKLHNSCKFIQSILWGYTWSCQRILEASVRLLVGLPEVSGLKHTFNILNSYTGASVSWWVHNFAEFLYRLINLLSKHWKNKLI